MHANCLNIVVVNNNLLVEVDHQLIDKNSNGDWLALDVEYVPRLMHYYQVLVLLGIHLQVVKEGFLCSLVLFEQDAIWIWVADFTQEIWENGSVFFVHPMRALFVNMVVISFESSVLLP